MNWPQSSYSSANSSSTFGGQQPSSSSSGGFGTPSQQHPLYLGPNQQQQQQQQQGYGTPGGGGFSSNAGGYQSNSAIVPASLQQHTFSTSSPQHQQQQQQQPQQGGFQQGNMQGMGYQSTYGAASNQYGQSGGPSIGGGFGGSTSSHGQQMGQSMMPNGSAYGQYANQSAGQYGAGAVYGSPQSGAASLQAGSGAPAGGVGRYLPGYLTASSLSGSPRQSMSASAHDGRLSPEQSHREAATGGSFGAGSSRLFASSTSSAGTAGKESPSRSPKQSLFSSSAYGSSRSLALTPATGSRTRRTSNNALVRSSHDDYMEEDAPPVDTLDDFDNDAGVPYIASPPPQQTQPAPMAAGSMSPSKRRDVALPNGPTSSFGSGQAQNGSASSSSNTYKLIVFGFPPNLQSSVLKDFASIAPLAYNSIQDPSPSANAVGSNWFTIAYDNEWAALRALRKNGDIVGDSMIGVKWADASRALDSLSSDLVPASQQQQQQQQSSSLPRSSTTSNLGTPATVLPASQAFLPKPNQNGAAMKKSATLNKINDMGKIDPSIFKQPDQTQQKQGGGVVGTLTNLIFGF